MRRLLELRRLAYRVPRDEDARVVLVDALLETYPGVLQTKIGIAERWRERDKKEWAIFFIPERLRKKAHPFSELFMLQKNPARAFTFYPTWEWERAVRTGKLSQERLPPAAAKHYRNAVLVYRTSTKSRL